MNNPFIGQVTLFAGNFPPRAYAFCQGQLMSIASNTALFSILGTTYGGDGRTTFALPDLRGRCAIHPGRGPGLSTYVLGERQGIETVNLNLLQLPSHSHTVDASSLTLQIPASTAAGGATEPSATESFSSSGGIGAPIYGGTANTHMNMVAGGSMTVQNTGGSQSHENRRPFIAINYIIALQGTYPSRS